MTHHSNGFSLSSLLTAGLVLAVGVLALGKEFDLIDPLLARRGVGIAFGGLLMLAGNFLPKLVLPASARTRNPGRAAATERRAGWIFVATGIAVIVAWLLVPAGQGFLVTAAIGLAGFALVGVDAAALILSPAIAPDDSDAAPQPATQVQRRTLFMVLHALLWVFAIFLADALWGDNASKWMVIGFVIANGALAVWVLPQIRKAKG